MPSREIYEMGRIGRGLHAPAPNIRARDQRRHTAECAARCADSAERMPMRPPFSLAFPPPTSTAQAETVRTERLRRPFRPSTPSTHNGIDNRPVRPPRPFKPTDTTENSRRDAGR